MEEKKKVLPTFELLGEMESLEIHGGIGGPGNDPDDFNMYCKGANCQHPLNTTTDCNMYCGGGTICLV